MVGKQKERPVATRPKPNSHSATNHDGELCAPDSDTSIVVPYSAAPMCQLADALRFGHVGACLFTYHMVCTSTSFTVPLWYRPIGEIAPGCLLSAAALPGTAVCSIYQFSIAPIGEMAPGVPCKALNKII